MAHKKKLIEVALPLEAINQASAREKSIRHGHPSTLHLWWARRPLAACRAVLFASLVDDPSSHPNQFPTAEAQETERKRLFALIEELVKWENSNNEDILHRAKQEILKSTQGNPPPVLDPFCGGGSIPLEAQRLGLEASGSDLNPVAVLITKALIEIPPKFANRPPLNPESQKQLGQHDSWHGAAGLAEDIRYYGQWMRAEAEKRIGLLYPKVPLPEEYGGGAATVIAWLWARTVASPNPAAQGHHVPLIHAYALSTKKGKQAWVEPIIDHQNMTYRFEIRTAIGKPRAGTVNRNGGSCLLTNTPMPLDYIRQEGKAGRMKARLMAIVAEGTKGRIYLAPNEQHEKIAETAKPDWKPDTFLPEQALGFRVQQYGMIKHADLFTNRQLVALTTFSDLISEARSQILKDAQTLEEDDFIALDQGGTGLTAYADAIAVYLGFAVDKGSDYWSSICTWNNAAESNAHTFTRQALPMVWDYTEANPFSNSGGNWLGTCIKYIWKVVQRSPQGQRGAAKQQDAVSVASTASSLLISTDPPYYDNISYADLSDFFYVWMRRSLGNVYPQLFSTLMVPKAPELVATPYRFAGDKSKARQFFEEGLAKVFQQMRFVAAEGYPLTIYYAFKQAETEDNSAATASTGWETMLQGLIQGGFSISGTWPMRTERTGRLRDHGSNALASSIVLVCRPRPETAQMTDRRDFIAQLKRELPNALKQLQQGNIAPVDLAQAAIGPGIAVFSRYKKVIEADGATMKVRTALQLINQGLDEYLTEQEGDYDTDTRWALAWYEQYNFKAGSYGEAEVLSKAKNTSVQGIVDAGILESRAGKVRLLRRDELRQFESLTARREGSQESGQRWTVWEGVQSLIRELEQTGESGAAALLSDYGRLAETSRDLAYRLYALCERKGWTQDALAYNSLVVAWPELEKLARTVQKAGLVQEEFGI